MPDSNPEPNSLETLISRNIETIHRIEKAFTASRTRSEVIADSITWFCGSAPFVFVQLALIGAWIAGNLLMSHKFQWDAPYFPGLSLALCVEAVLLTSFVLISQKRVRKLEDQRNGLDLQINLLAEQEISEILRMLKLLVDHAGLQSADSKVANLHEPVDPASIAEEIAANTTSDSSPGIGDGEGHEVAEAIGDIREHR